MIKRYAIFNTSEEKFVSLELERGDGMMYYYWETHETVRWPYDWDHLHFLIHSHHNRTEDGWNENMLIVPVTTFCGDWIICWSDSFYVTDIINDE